MNLKLINALNVVNLMLIFIYPDNKKLNINYLFD